MGIDFKIFAEYKKNGEWILFNDKLGYGENDYSSDYFTEKQVGYWVSSYWTGKLLRHLLGDSYNNISNDISEDAKFCFDYLSTEFYELKDIRLELWMIESEGDMEYYFDIIREFKNVENYITDKYNPEDFRLCYIRY